MDAETLIFFLVPEFSFSWATDQGISDVNTAVGNTGAALLLQNITDMKTTLSDMSIDLPVGTSDAGSYFNNEVLAAVDYGVRFYFHSDAIFKWMIADVCEYFCSIRILCLSVGIHCCCGFIPGVDDFHYPDYLLCASLSRFLWELLIWRVM